MILKMRAKHAVNHIMKVIFKKLLIVRYFAYRHFRDLALAFPKYAKSLVICTPKFGNQEPKCL